jgi:hypothetical protein
MKSPNELNLDEWLFHYFEGDLTVEEESMFEEFLLANPHYDAQFEAWGAARIQKVESSYPQKKLLLKPWFGNFPLHKVAVISAILINVVLAGLIIASSSGNNNHYEGVQRAMSYKPSEQNNSQKGLNIKSFESDKKFDDSRIRYKSTQSSFNENNQSLLLKYAILSIDKLPILEKPPRAKDKTIVFVSDSKNSPLRQSKLRNLANVLTNIPIKEATIPQSRQISSDDNIVLGVLTSPISSKNGEKGTHTSTVDSSEKGINGSIVEENIDADKKAITNKNSINDNKKRMSERKKEEDVKVIKSQDSKEKIAKDASAKDKALNSNKRIKGGDLLLTNTRSQEYLIPGANRNQINFAHVGSDFSNSAYINSSLQWPGRTSQMIVNQLGYDMFIPQIKSGLGIQFMYSSYGNGTIRDFETALTYSPKFFIAKNMTLEPAVRLRMSSMGVNRSQLLPGTWVEYDRGNSFQYSQEQYDAFVNRSVQQDLGLGLMFNTKWAYFGVNADNVLGNINQSLHYGNVATQNRAPLFFNAVMGAEYQSIRKKVLLSAQLIYQNHGSLNKIWFGSRVKLNYISLGASVSNLGEPLFSAGYVTKSVSILYSGDYSYSKVLNDKFLSHQLLLRFTLKESRMKKLLLN